MGGRDVPHLPITQIWIETLWHAPVCHSVSFHSRPIYAYVRMLLWRRRHLRKATVAESRFHRSITRCRYLHHRLSSEGWKTSGGGRITYSLSLGRGKLRQLQRPRQQCGFLQRWPYPCICSDFPAQGYVWKSVNIIWKKSADLFSMLMSLQSSLPERDMKNFSKNMLSILANKPKFAYEFCVGPPVIRTSSACPRRANKSNCQSVCERSCRNRQWLLQTATCVSLSWTPQVTWSPWACGQRIIYGHLTVGKRYHYNRKSRF